MQNHDRKFGLGCDCKQEHWCGHCLTDPNRQGKASSAQRIIEANPVCSYHGRLTAKDVITAYPEGHSHHEK